MATGGAIGDFTLEGLRALVDGELEGAFKSLLFAPSLIDAGRYGVFSGGKRVRPVLALALCADLGGDPTKLAPAAVALELLHCASLVHDDLPALDNDDYRRGKPACHRAFSESSAILAGDLLIALAHERVLTAPLSADTQVLLGQVIARAFIDLCAGQELDLIPEERRGDLLSIHRLKTGALFRACACFGVIGAGRSGRDIENAASLGHGVGLVFQIADDFLDVHGSDSARGRPGSSDQRNGKENLFTGAAREPWKMLAEAEKTIRDTLAELSSHGTPRFDAIIEAILAPMEEARSAHTCIPL
jgi:geranylgeranyl diphosphate synthase type II